MKAESIGGLKKKRKKEKWPVTIHSLAKLTNCHRKQKGATFPTLT